MRAMTTGQLTGFSPLIAQPCIAVLVGAGISKGLGFRLMGGDDFEPLFSEFRDHLKEDRCDGILDHVELPDRERPNLEDVFEQITQISASAATLRNCANGCRLADWAARADKMIGAFVAERYPFPEDKEFATRVYTEVLDALWPGTYGNVLPIFTTNYDLALESFWLANRDSYKLIRVLETSALHQVDSSNSRQIVLMKLHGSTGWTFEENPQHEARVVTIPLETPSLLGAVQEHAIVVPVRNKAPQREPFLTYFAYLEECAANAAGLVVLGYAFNELGVCNAIRTGLARRRGLPLHVLVVDITPSDVILKLDQIAPPGSIVAAPVEYDFKEGNPSTLQAAVSPWVYDLPEFADPLCTTAPSARWITHQSNPVGMIEPTEAGLLIQWNDNASYQKPGYWEWRRRIACTDFTLSFEISPERVGRGWYAGIQLLDASGAVNLASLVLAAGRSPVNSTSDAHALAIVMGNHGWKLTSGWGKPVGRDEWIPAALEVRGGRCQGVIRDEISELFPPLEHEPRLLRIGAFGEDERVQQGKCLLRNLQLKGRAWEP